MRSLAKKAAGNAKTAFDRDAGSIALEAAAASLALYCTFARLDTVLIVPPPSILSNTLSSAYRLSIQVLQVPDAARPFCFIQRIGSIHETSSPLKVDQHVAKMTRQAADSRDETTPLLSHGDSTNEQRQWSLSRRS